MNALILTSGGLIAARILNAWLGAGHTVAALWTGTKAPAKVLGRDHALGLLAKGWSIASLARRRQISVLPNPKLSSQEAEVEIARLGADVLITAITRQIVPESILARFPGRAVNFHPALLPHYRGPNPRIGMLLDGTAGTCGGVTLHCLARGIDEGDIVGARAVPYDAARGFVDWDVRLADAAGNLVRSELQEYLGGHLRARAQAPKSGNYRKVTQTEVTVSGARSASQIRWLCERLAGSDSLRFRVASEHSQSGKKYAVSRLLGVLGPRTREDPRIRQSRIEFDATDARIAVERRRTPASWFRLFSYWRAIARASLSGEHGRRFAPGDRLTNRKA
jgi:methionyl-tRNA formyltransferase